ncbi:probable cellulose synthase a catalytic subunit 10 [UDP-forming] [Phtheirospermum japonicum]|uniref:Probable cellulose synthase a catalytic subunit 10 [UDP-forming] n=1 Tax=Phtheirospermum japonicum TaxID=374723 RepID=A0A830BQ11_9LAMI|nr:probable cellulose synthase a catalytic subunit 10 [UDP-forming] [Phtheirospermum japonicum]
MVTFLLHAMNVPFPFAVLVMNTSGKMETNRARSVRLGTRDTKGVRELTVMMMNTTLMMIWRRSLFILREKLKLDLNGMVTMLSCLRPRDMNLNNRSLFLPTDSQ